MPSIDCDTRRIFGQFIQHNSQVVSAPTYFIILSTFLLVFICRTKKQSSGYSSRQLRACSNTTSGDLFYINDFMSIYLVFIGLLPTLPLYFIFFSVSFKRNGNHLLSERMSGVHHRM